MLCILSYFAFLHLLYDYFQKMQNYDMENARADGVALGHDKHSFHDIGKRPVPSEGQLLQVLFSQDGLDDAPGGPGSRQGVEYRPKTYAIESFADIRFQDAEGYVPLIAFLNRVTDSMNLI